MASQCLCCRSAACPFTMPLLSLGYRLSLHHASVISLFRPCHASAIALLSVPSPCLCYRAACPFTMPLLSRCCLSSHLACPFTMPLLPHLLRYSPVLPLLPQLSRHQTDMDTLAEWLRRRPAKPMGSPRVGSNPTGVVCRTMCWTMCWTCDLVVCNGCL